MITRILARFMVCGALTAALIMAVGHASDKGVAWYLKAAFIIGMICVAIGEFLAWHNSATAWHQRRAGSLVLWGILGVILTGGVLYTNFSASAGNNDTKAGIQKAAHFTTADLGRAEKEQSGTVTRIEERLRMSPQRTPEAARAAIQRAKADRFWGLTKECTETKGAQTRAFCDAYASAVSDESMGTEAIRLREELKVAIAELAETRRQRAQKPAAVSDDQAHISAMVHLTGLDNRSARTLDSMMIPVMVQAMLLLGGILLANERYRDEPRKPWIDLAKWSRRLAYFQAPPSAKATPGNALLIERRETITDEAFKRVQAALRGATGAAA